MTFQSTYLKSILVLLLTVSPLVFYACSGGDYTDRTFVGKWKSSKLETPIYLYANGEWEVKTEAGAVLQYGIWEYKADRITWSFKTDSGILRDANTVLSANVREFRLRESDGTTTIFSRLD